LNKYLKQYKISNIQAMRRNDRKDSKECTEDFHGRLVILSSATSGIGYETARLYASHGAHLIFIARNEEKSINLREEIRNNFDVECEYMIADYSRISDVKHVAYEILKLHKDIDVFIHSAGVFSTGRIITEDKNELVFQVNYLASFILNYMLKDKLKAQDNARVILVNSEGHRFAIGGIRLDDLDWNKRRYIGLRSYGSAETAELLSMIKFDEYFQDSGVTINAMHPGHVKTNMGENNGRLYRFFKHTFINPTSKSPKISATALYYLGVSSEIEGVSGKFFNLTMEEEPAPPALDKEVAEELWDLTIKMVGLE
jgi:NAD(P)-dependent dehydrogenase (short-subunit alcohol dehydrogenase family)